MQPDVERQLSWRGLVELMLTPVAVTDADGAVLAASPEFVRLVDCDRLRERVPPLLRRGHDCAVPPEGSGDAVQIGLPARTGADLATRARVLPASSGSSSWCLLQVDDPDASGRDALTGLVTREALVLRVRQALAHRERHGGGVEVVVMDLDRFKAINDRHGHVVGDEVLVEVARRLRAVCRPEDTVARWGGDEFVLLLHDGQDTGELLCQRIRAAVAQPVRTSRGVELTVSASCGSIRAEPGDDPATLMHAADMQMYERKRHHRPGPGRSELSARLARAQATAQELHDALDETMRRAPTRP